MRLVGGWESAVTLEGLRRIFTYLCKLAHHRVAYVVPHWKLHSLV